MPLPPPVLPPAPSISPVPDQIPARPSPHLSLQVREKLPYTSHQGHHRLTPLQWCPPAGYSLPPLQGVERNVQPLRTHHQTSLARSGTPHPRSSVKKTTAKHRLFDQVAPGQAPTPAFEEPMEATPAPPSSTSIADTLVSVTFTLINGLMTQQVGERVTKAFRNYMGSNGVHSAPMIGRQSVSFTIRNALLSKARHFINQSLGLPDLRYTTTNQQQARKSRNTHNTPQHLSKGIIDTHLTKAEFAKKFNMTRNNITDFKPITNKAGTKQAILTFSTNIAPLNITSDTTQIEVSPLLLALHRCYKCQHFGHTHARCRNQYTRCKVLAQ